ncbi:uncharacterized protein N7529_004217, partial [Penicillium soppii]|uniref:uncharacterized protein n=1 Tax=Penicillium soppii TaxID=69789 RepID=UPI0025491676
SSQPFVHDIDFHTFNMILSGACAAFTCLAIFTLMTLHATHFSNPYRQTRIMRICALLPAYSIFSFLAVCFPNAYVYLVAWLDLFQSIALCGFFFLLCNFLNPDEDARCMFLASYRPKKGKMSSKNMNGLMWFQRKWLSILQYPVVALFVAVASCITQSADVYCLESNKAYFGHLWLNIIRILSVVIAVMAVIKFYIALKPHISHHHPLVKLIAFKLIVGLVFFENIVFTILRSTSALSPTAKLTYADVHMGIQTMIICIQMVPIACFFYYAYGIGPYSLSRSSTSSSDRHDYSTVDSNGAKLQQGYHGGLFGAGAWMMLCNPIEYVRDIRDTFHMINRVRQAPQRTLPSESTAYR